MTGKLSIDRHGRVFDPAGHMKITYNDPWPLKFAKAGVTGKMRGVVEHTMAGFMQPTIDYFNGRLRDKNGNPIAPGGSAHFAVAQSGWLHQFVPLGQGYETYHAFAANSEFYGVETEDFGNPHLPISDSGLNTWAALFELLSRYAAFPCQVTDDCNGRGLAYHRMCASWNLSGHTCPGATMTDMVRVNQRAEIVHRAHLIRDPAPVAPAEPVRIDADGHTTWGQYAQRHALRTQHLVWQTAMHATAGFGPLEGAEADKLAGEIPPKGTVIWAGKYPAR